jgi:hypothetical protein
MGNCNCKHGTTGQATTCPECDILQLARNNYFTGKLLVERDFTDEQRYTMGKLRRHNQRLHGWGVACGLKVKEHPNPACQSQYVVVEPGTAIDCCGREILVQHEEYFDFESKFLANWQKQKGPNSQPDSDAHVIQVCVSYRECPTEQVPAIFDDCSAGAGACQPNRILEGHSLDVIIDPSDLDHDPQGVSLKWDFTKNIANVVCAAEDDDSNRLYVLTSATSGGTSNAALYVIKTEHYALVASATFPGSAGLDVAVDSSGQYVYVAVQPSTAGAAPQLYVYAAADDFTATVNQVAVGNVSDSTLQLAPVPGSEGSVLAYGKTAGFVAMGGLNAAGPSQVGNTLPIVPVSVVLSENNQYGYVASSGSNTISVIQLAGEAVVVTPWTIALPGGAQPASLAISATKNGDTLAALDTTGKTLYFVTIPSAGPGSATVLTQTVSSFAYAPMQVLLSPGGRWAYVLEQDTTGTSPTAYVQAVDVHAVALGETNVLGPAVAVGIGATSESLSQDGSHLYVSFNDTTQPNLGGLAIVDVTQADCGDIFQTLIDGCPDCSQGNCLVLATIPGYVYQSGVTQKEIHNLRGRRLLPSTDLLTKAVECLIEQTPSTGPAGPQGPQGNPGGNGATWYEGNGAPAAAIGNNNDFYLNTNTGTGNGDIYQKQSGSWVKIGNIQGPSGQNGTNGATWYEGNGAPAAAIGNNNDFYLNTNTGAGDDDIYQKQSGSWVKIGNIQGPAGSAGVNGATWYEGNVAPTTLENNNDFYLDTSTGDVYQMQSGTWKNIGNIKGPSGNNGVGITEVDPTFVTCDTPGAASLTPNATGLTLNLTIPGCCNKSLVRIESVSWERNGNTIPTSQLGKPGLGIAFSGSVESVDLTVNSIAVLFPVPNGTLTSWQEAELTITPGNFLTLGNTSSAFTAASGAVNGVQIVVNAAPTGALESFHSARIVVKGDFIRDASANHYAIDGDHLPPWLPNRPTGDGIEGGTFESWFGLTGG